VVSLGTSNIAIAGHRLGVLDQHRQVRPEVADHLIEHLPARVRHPATVDGCPRLANDKSIG
jgi:hypothetical protein